MSTLEFNNLLTSNAKYLKGFAYNFTRNVEDAEDLLQDTMVKALRYKDHFQEGTNFKGWLFTIMRNIFINNYKRKKLRNTITDQTTNQYFLNYGKVSEDLVSTRLNEKDINRAIATLTYEFRTPFQLFLDGFHYDEIAQTMGIPMGTVKSRIFHARKRLMDDLRDLR
ncbi:MAG: sigma-70 family RNA polymerase sigma factor [Flavobacteriales bacterium]|jgi:RNA polymerase sigma-70 factor (ECF subfamily)